MQDIQALLEREEWHQAHAALAQHFRTREPHFPLDPARLQDIASCIRRRFPKLDTAAADAVMDGRYHLLGYRDVRIGRPPDWHRDPVHGRSAPALFWGDISYLDPAYGDHKITWEINRHQHWLALGRAFQLTSDRRYYDEFVSQFESWMSANPPLQGTNWASMLELAFRCLSWVWSLHFFVGAASEADEQPWLVDLVLGIDRQLQHVEQNLSRYFSPNTHLTGEALALYVVGQSLPELASSVRYATIGRDVLLREGRRQILPDGGHVERSAHYHRYSTDFYMLALNVARITKDSAAPQLEAYVRAQAHYLRTIADDAGRLPLLGDDDGGQLFPIVRRDPTDCRESLASAAVLLREPGLAVSVPPEGTFWFCANHDDVDRLVPPSRGWPSRALPSSGYCVSRNARGDHLIFDCGPHGFLNGGHAHADALAVVLTVAGRPLLVDPGTATYTMDAAVRDRFRSTAMHNTVVVDGRSQSEPRGPFHWRTTVNATCTLWQSGPDRDSAAGRHDGYGAAGHRRSITALHGIGWIVVDDLSGIEHCDAAAMWHLHPSWVVAPRDDRTVELVHTDGTRLGLATTAELHVVADDRLNAYAPVYGRIGRAPCLASVIHGRESVRLATFIAADATWMPIRIQQETNSTFVETEAGTLTITTGVDGIASVNVSATVASSLHN